jgi:hypothetical protein
MLPPMNARDSGQLEGTSDRRQAAGPSARVFGALIVVIVVSAAGGCSTSAPQGAAGAAGVGAAGVGAAGIVGGGAGAAGADVVPEPGPMFCARWVALRCSSAFSCLQNIPSDTLAACQTRYQSVCDTATQEFRTEIGEGLISYDAMAATACFDAWQADGCRSELKSLLATCAPFLVGQEPDGMSCRAVRQSQSGTYCNGLVDMHGRCTGSGVCATPAGPGADCSQVACAPGYACTSESDARGLPVQVCRGAGIPDGGSSSAPPPQQVDAGGCSNPYEQPGVPGTCITKSLPGQGCGGEYNLTCLGDTVCGIFINTGNSLSCIGTAQPGGNCTPFVTSAGQSFQATCPEGYSCIDIGDTFDQSCVGIGINCVCEPPPDLCTTPDMLLEN